MPITLDDAVERAKLMAGNDGLLSQYSYQQLYSSLGETDRYAFNMALIDNGIIAKTGKAAVARVRKVIGKFDPMIGMLGDTEEITDESYVSERVNKAGLRLLQAQFDVDESGQVFYGAGEQEAPQVEQVNQQEVDNLRSALENSGIHVSADGQVSFYKSSIPGVYTDRLPQSMPLETAVGYYNQISATATNEEAKSSKLLDYLSQLSSVADNVSGILNELKSYKFSPKSQSELVRSIAEGISSLSGFYESDKQTDLQAKLNKLKEQVEQYRFDQGAKADNYKVSAESLAKLQVAKVSDPSLYNAVVKGLGGL